MDAILSNLLSKVGYQLKKDDGANFLATGYCKGCHKCSFPCKTPSKQTFSLESTGVDVEDTVRRLFNTELQWFGKRNPNDVDYMMKIIAYFPKNRVNNLGFEDVLVTILNNLNCTRYKIGSDKYQIRLAQLK
jgi:hypothetical protein